MNDTSCDMAVDLWINVTVFLVAILPHTSNAVSKQKAKATTPPLLRHNVSLQGAEGNKWLF